jgi:hypothetical protein
MEGASLCWDEEKRALFLGFSLVESEVETLQRVSAETEE